LWSTTGNLVSHSADEPDNRSAPTSTAELPTERDNDAAPALGARPNQERESAARHNIIRILELDSLELRRVRADLLFTYKLVFGLIDASLRAFFVPRFSEARRGHDYCFFHSVKQT